MSILKNVFKLAKNVINKNPIIFKVFPKKVFKLSPRYWVLSFGVIFILIPLLNHRFVKKLDGKKNLVRLVGSNNFEIVFTLLAKVLAI